MITGHLISIFISIFYFEKSIFSVVLVGFFFYQNEILKFLVHVTQLGKFLQMNYFANRIFC